MIEIAESLNNFASEPKQSGFESPEEQLVEIPLYDLNLVLGDLVSIYNNKVEVLRKCGIMPGRELARTRESDTLALRAEKDPIQKMLLLNAFIKQLDNKIYAALNTKVHEGEKNINVTTKIKARAIQIIDYIRVIIADDPKRKEISLDSSQCRILFSGKENSGKVSRRDTIRAMERAKNYWPDLRLEHRPNDGRQTMRLIGSLEDLSISPEFEYKDDKPKCSIWQRSRLEEIAVIFGFTEPNKADF